MKKMMSVLGAIGLSAAVSAAVNDSLLMFSTKGPDKYVDGSPVLANECYALCYVTDPASFAIKADGTAAAGGEVLLTAPVAAPAEGGGMHCPNLIYVIPAEKAESLSGGAYAVYLLDTRVPDAAAPGGYSVAGVAEGKAAVVNGAGAVASGATVGTGASGVTAFNGTVVEGGSVAVASVIDQPAITAIKVDGADVKLTVSGLSPAASYKVLTGAGPSCVSVEVNDATQNGNEFTVRKDAGQFFKIVGTRVVEQK